MSLTVSSQINTGRRDSLQQLTQGRSKPIKAIIKTSLFSPFYWQIPLTGEYRLLGEIMVGKKQSFNLGASYLTRSLMFLIGQSMPANSGNSKISGNGYRIQGSWRYYLVSRIYRPEGLYVSAHASFASVKYHFKDFSDDYQFLEHFNINLLIGGQLIIANRVCLDVFIGPGFKNNSYIERCRPGYGVFDFESLPSTMYSHFKFNLGMNVGIAL